MELVTNHTGELHGVFGRGGSKLDYTGAGGRPRTG